MDGTSAEGAEADAFDISLGMVVQSVLIDMMARPETVDKIGRAHV